MRPIWIAHLSSQFRLNNLRKFNYWFTEVFQNFQFLTYGQRSTLKKEQWPNNWIPNCILHCDMGSSELALGWCCCTSLGILQWKLKHCWNTNLRLDESCQRTEQKSFFFKGRSCCKCLFNFYRFLSFLSFSTGTCWGIIAERLLLFQFHRAFC